ncbi:hypothetical protein BDN71DRAFT_1438686 [Pleurotus eryngii]|uniref:Peptidase C14 caspase domain-containing protein n=1 Tax=Pleurotus eryngii TaxID=5323 RepID=A0A9P6DL71_PLEER|nr:hypothetical protein BDN71DRAFT_1438686 [Pleurotus eryngii]
MPSSRLFALIVGIDAYKSGSIWNLESCAQDAKKVQAWLTHDLCVPKDQICMLLDHKATKAAIEDRFMSHLVRNPAIERGDAILIYFAGHGSVIPAPKNWFEGESRASLTDTVEVLCPHDHHTKTFTGRNAGISDRSMQALLTELCKAKGDNVTLILDCCFSPRQTKELLRERRSLRWTPSPKSDPSDLLSGLWGGAPAQKPARNNGFYRVDAPTHVLIAACRPGEGAAEGKEGGRLTAALLEASATLQLHNLTYKQLVNRLAAMMSAGQEPVCAGRHKERVLFNGVPFVPDARFVPAGLDEEKRLRVEVGSIHGVVLGSELTLHNHNIRGSPNAVLTGLKVLEVHPTWSICKPSTPGFHSPRRAWAKIRKWHNRPPFRIHLKKTLTSLLRICMLSRHIPSKLTDDETDTKGTMNLLRVRSSQAHLSLGFSGNSAHIEHHDDLMSLCRRVVRIDDTMGALSLLDKAARFHLHLHRRNPESPLHNLVQMELYKLDPISWRKTGTNLLKDGQAKIDYEKDALYSVVMHNNSQVDLWPSLVYMDPNCYGITMLYHPDAKAKAAPLPKSSRLEVGTGGAGSEALSFEPKHGKPLDSGFLKLFVTTSFVSMSVIEQGPPLSLTAAAAGTDNPFSKAGLDELWDTTRARINIQRMA